MGKNETIIRSGLADQVYEVIRNLVLSMEFEPGARLVIDQLAARLSVSATPVREALARLAAERLIDSTPYRGFTVMLEPTPDELGESFEARRGIDEFAARLGCERATDERIAEMRVAADRITQLDYDGSLGKYLEFLSLNRLFHEMVVDASNNRFLSDAAKSLFHDAVIARTLHARGVPDLHSIIVEHEAIVAAFEARDPDAAVATVRAHAEGGAERMLRFAWGSDDRTGSAGPSSVPA